MSPLEAYLEHAPELAQEVINAFGTVGGGSASLRPEFDALLDKAHLYRILSAVVENHRENNVLTGEKEAELNAAHLNFAQAYKDFWEKHETGLRFETQSA